MKTFNRLIALSAAISAMLLLAGAKTYESLPSPNGWPMAGQNQQSTSFQSREHTINTSNVANLQVKWIYNTDAHDADFNVHLNKVVPKSSIIMTPSVDKENEIIYFGDINGRMHAVNTQTHQPIWIKSIVYDYLANDIVAMGTDITKTLMFSRTTPVIYKNLIIFGLQPLAPNGAINDLGMLNYDSAMATNGGVVMAVDRFTGNLVWKKQIAPELPLSRVAASFTIFGNTLYGSLANLEEAVFPPLFDGGAAFNVMTQVFQASGIPLPAGGYQCCHGHGLAFAMDASTGQILWKKPTIEPSAGQGFGGWAGASIWSSSPPIDPSRQSVYFTSGNLFNVAANFSACMVSKGYDPMTADTSLRTQCMPSGVHQDAILSLNLKTGSLNWTRSYVPMDVGGAGCFGKAFGDPNSGCNDPLATPATIPQFGAQYIDADFASGALLVDLGSKQSLIAAQKNGTVYSINPSTGSLNWSTTDGPSSLYGGHEWGVASDGVRVYTQITNADLVPVTLVNEYSPTPTGPGGFFSTLDVNTGQILWQTRDPNVATINPAYVRHATIYGRLSLANGVLYGSSTNHTLFALDASNGRILWQDNTNIVGSGYAAPAVVEGTVYWPTGYTIVTQFAGSPYTPIDANDPYTPYDNKLIVYTVPNASGLLDDAASVLDTN